MIVSFADLKTEGNSASKTRYVSRMTAMDVVQKVATVLKCGT